MHLSVILLISSLLENMPRTEKILFMKHRHKGDSTVGSIYSSSDQPTKVRLGEVPVRLVRIHLHADVRRRRVCMRAMFSANKVVFFLTNRAQN